MKTNLLPNRLSLLIILGTIMVSTLNVNSISIRTNNDAVSVVNIEKPKKELKGEKRLKKKTKRLSQKLEKLGGEESMKEKGKIILIIGIVLLVLGLVSAFSGKGLDGCIQFIVGIALAIGGLVMIIIGLILGT